MTSLAIILAIVCGAFAGFVVGAFVAAKVMSDFICRCFKASLDDLDSATIKKAFEEWKAVK